MVELRRLGRQIRTIYSDDNPHMSFAGDFMGLLCAVVLRRYGRDFRTIRDSGISTQVAMHRSDDIEDSGMRGLSKHLLETPEGIFGG